MSFIDNTIAATKFWGVSLLCLGGLTLSVEIYGYLTKQVWTSLSFIDGIKMTGRDLLRIHTSDWVYNPHVLVWLHDFLAWLPMSPTLIFLGLLGFFAPVKKSRGLQRRIEQAKLDIS